jgi:hypothetical protein
MTANSEAVILSRVIEPEKPNMPPEAARALLELDFGAEDRARMNELAAKARQGMLNADEEQELDNYLDVGHLLALMQSKARRSLREAGLEP